MIDPILPLSISIAEGMGTFAVFLGSGTSRPSGIPTGGDILNDAIKVLFKLENNVEEADDDDEINEWFNESQFKDYTYSKILEELCPTKEERRKFLEKYFVGKKPTESHYIIADMVKDGLIKVIVTTNFDRLIEDALDSKDVPYTIISSEEELKTSHPREHSNCWLLKLHGDYKRLNIKNTRRELEKLESNIENEFQDVLDKFGIIVMGYSGSDEGVMSCFERRDSKYMLYWLTREKPNQTVKELIQQKEGREIKRKSAETFLKELYGKIKIFQVHNTGDTPEFVLHQIIEHVKENDMVSVREAIKNQWKTIRDGWHNKYYKFSSFYTEGLKNSHEEGQKNLFTSFNEFETYCNTLTSIGLVLIDFSNDCFQDVTKLFQKIYDLPDEILEEELAERGQASSKPSITAIPNGVIHNMFYCFGAYALKEEKFDELAILLNTELITGRSDYMGNNPIWSTNVFYPDTFAGDTTIVFKYLIDSYNDKPFLKEFFYSEIEFVTYLCQFNLISCLYSTKKKLETLENDYYIVYPNFSRYSGLNRDKLQKLLFKMKGQYSFLDNLSRKTFGETTEIFVQKYPGRCEYINNFIDKTRTDVIMAFNRLPSDLFE